MEQPSTVTSLRMRIAKTIHLQRELKHPTLQTKNQLIQDQTEVTLMMPLQLSAAPMAVSLPE
jgi:hypothetical protein